MSGGVVGASLFTKQKCVERPGAFSMQDGVCMSLEQRAEAVEGEKTALLLEGLFGGVLAGLCGGN